MAMRHSYVITSGASAAVIIAAAAELPILVMPPFVGDDLVRANAAPNVITPASLRRVLATSKRPALSHPSQGVLVLQFCLSDILKPGAAAAFGADEFAKRVRKAVKQLSGLPLIPTAAGTLAHVRYEPTSDARFMRRNSSAAMAVSERGAATRVNLCAGVASCGKPRTPRYPCFRPKPRVSCPQAMRRSCWTCSGIEQCAGRSVYASLTLPGTWRRR